MDNLYANRIPIGWLNFMAYQPFKGYLIETHLFTYTLNMYHTTLGAPKGVVSDVFCYGSLRWGKSGHITSYSPRQVDPVRDDQSLYTFQFTLQEKKKEKNTWLFIYFDDYIPLNCASDRLFQTTSQMRGTVYFSGCRGN